MKTVEILQYTLRKGSGAAFHAIMQEISVPLHQRHGIDVVSFGNSLHDSDCYYLIRAFDSPESMAAFLDAFYASDDWRSGPREDIVRSIETASKTVMNLPSESVEGLRVGDLCYTGSLSRQNRGYVQQTAHASRCQFLLV